MDWVHLQEVGLRLDVLKCTPSINRLKNRTKTKTQPTPKDTSKEAPKTQATQLQNYWTALAKPLSFHSAFYRKEGYHRTADLITHFQVIQINFVFLCNSLSHNAPKMAPQTITTKIISTVKQQKGWTMPRLQTNKLPNNTLTVWTMRQQPANHVSHTRSQICSSILFFF